MAPVSPSTRARRAAAYYSAQAATYRSVGMTEAAERYEARAALASLNLQPACRLCGRELSDPKSIELGVGRDCFEHLAASVRSES